MPVLFDKKGRGVIYLIASSVILFCFARPYLPVCFSAFAEHSIIQDANTQSIGELNIGDRVMDPDWEWEFRTGYGYKGSGEKKPVTWIVVAKNHYSGGHAGSVENGVPHITLLSEEIIGKYPFDNSTERGSNWGSNHWGNSGAPDAANGIRKFLNGKSYTGDDKNEYNRTFYDSMSSGFKSVILKTMLPNKTWDTGDAYTTGDKIFLPSTTELGDTAYNYTYKTGGGWEYFNSDVCLLGQIGGDNWWYWTRSPDTEDSSDVCLVDQDGDFHYSGAHLAGSGILPALNMCYEAVVSGTPSEEGVYVLYPEKTKLSESNTDMNYDNGCMLF